MPILDFEQSLENGTIILEVVNKHFNPDIEEQYSQLTIDQLNDPIPIPISNSFKHYIAFSNEHTKILDLDLIHRNTLYYIRFNNKSYIVTIIIDDTITIQYYAEMCNEIYGTDIKICDKESDIFSENDFKTFLNNSSIIIEIVNRNYNELNVQHLVSVKYCYSAFQHYILNTDHKRIYESGHTQPNNLYYYCENDISYIVQIIVSDIVKITYCGQIVDNHIQRCYQDSKDFTKAFFDQTLQNDSTILEFVDKNYIAIEQNALFTISLAEQNAFRHYNSVNNEHDEVLNITSISPTDLYYYKFNDEAFIVHIILRVDSVKIIACGQILNNSLIQIDKIDNYLISTINIKLFNGSVILEKVDKNYDEYEVGWFAERASVITASGLATSDSISDTNIYTVTDESLPLYKAFKHYISNGNTHTRILHVRHTRSSELYYYKQNGQLYLVEIAIRVYSDNTVTITHYGKIATDLQSIQYCDRNVSIYTVIVFNALLQNGTIILEVVNKDYMEYNEFYMGRHHTAILIEEVDNTQSYVDNVTCSICMINKKQMCIDCGHLYCYICSLNLNGECFICKKAYTNMIKIYL
jgi:hypothetical protein